MALYKFVLVGKTQNYHKTEYNLQGDFNDGQLMDVARLLCDAHRAMSSGLTHFEYCLCIKVDGHVSAYSDMRVYHRPAALPYFTGARTVEPYNQFTGVVTSKSDTSLRSMEKFIHASVGYQDVSHFDFRLTMTLDLDGPLWRISLPYYRTALALQPELDNVRINLLGETEETSIEDGIYHVLAPVYKDSRHRTALGLPQSAANWQTRISAHCATIRALALEYQESMEEYSHRWGDNMTPLQGRFWEWAPEVLTCISVWYDLARALGYEVTVPHPGLNAVYGFNPGIVNIVDPGPDINFTDYGTYLYNVVSPSIQSGSTGGQVEPLAITEHNRAIVVSCLNVLYNAQRNIEIALEDALKGLVSYYYRSYGPLDINSFVSFWYCYVALPGGGFSSPIQVTGNNDPSASYAYCQKQSDGTQRFNTQYVKYMQQGGNKEGRALYDVWDKLSHHVFSAKNALHLLLAYLHPAGEFAPRDAPGVIYEFPYQQPQPGDYELNGSRCDWIETRSHSAAPFLQLSIPHQEATIAKVLPRHPNYVPAPMWDNSVYADNLIDAGLVSLNEALHGRHEQSVIWWSERYQQWRIGYAPSNSEAYEPPIPTQ